MVTSYALAYAPVGKSYLVRWEHGKGDLGEVVLDSTKKRGATKGGSVADANFDARIAFIDDVFKPDDVVWAEFGNNNGPFLRRAQNRGVIVFRIPNAHLADVEVPSRGNNESEEKENRLERLRRERAYRIALLARTNSRLFYPLRVVDAKIAVLAAYDRGFTDWQQLRIRSSNQLAAINRAMAFMDEDDVGKTELRIRQSLASPELLAETMEVEDLLGKQLQTTLRSLDLYRKVFEPINGCGTLISARIIAIVQDIRRFPNEKGFMRYSGWGLNSQGEILRRHKGESMGYTPRLKQACFQFGQQIAFYGRGDDWLRQIYEETLERELKRLDNKLHARNRARRKAIQVFLKHVYREWWRWEATEGTMEHLAMNPDDIPAGAKQILAYWYPELGIEI